MKKLPYWNHNAAYYPWADSMIALRRRVLDVGCGDGTLARYLSDGTRTVLGIDPFEDGIARARQAGTDEKLRFEMCSFEDFGGEDGSFDAVVFAASLHHLDTEFALKKAARLLSDGGILLVIGLMKPETLGEKLLDAARCVPSLVISKLHRMTSTEALNIPVSYSFGSIKQLRAVADEVLPGARIRHALHYRYLLQWEKNGEMQWEKNGETH